MIRRFSLLPLLCLALVAGGCNGQTQSIRSVEVRTGSAEARRESLADLRTAWRTREVLNDDSGRKAEQRFLVRLSGSVPRFKGTESYAEFCRFWNECLREHLSRFPESAT